MTARAGMSNLIGRLRSMVNDSWQLHQDLAAGDGSNTTFWLGNKPDKAGGTVSVGGTVQGTASYSWDTEFGKVAITTPPPSLAAVVVEYQAAQFGDDQLQDVLDGGATLLEWRELQWRPDTVPGDIEYHRCYANIRDLEEATSGTTSWIVRDSTGLEVGTAQYAINYVTGEFRFPVDTQGTALYLTARSCDIYAAAADVWQQRCAMMALNAYDVQSDAQRFSRSQAMANALQMEATMRQRSGQNIHRGALQMGRMVRTDLVATRW